LTFNEVYSWLYGPGQWLLNLGRWPRSINQLNNKEFRFFLICLNSIFSTLPQSEYTSRAVSTPRVRYIRACVYFCLNRIFNKIGYNCFIIFQDYLNIKILNYDENFEILWNFRKFVIGRWPRSINQLNNKEFRFFLICLNSIFSTLSQSEYTSRAVSTPRVRYIRACVYFCLLSIRCFNVVPVYSTK
jgi:hypothetical protein